MDLQLKGKTAFITGSTSGIGFATAKVLLEEGASVTINGRTEESVATAVNKLHHLVTDGIVYGIAADFLNPTAVSSVVDQLGTTDILINNVGIYTAQSFFETSTADWENQLSVNLMSGVGLSKAILPKMLKANWGRILFISSECATLVPSDLIAYSTTKAALLALSRGLAQLTSGTAVTVNSIIPGSTLTEGAEAFLADVAQKENKTAAVVEAEFFNKVRTSSLLQRFAAVEEVAHTIAYYVSPLSAATNGAAVKLDGGSMGGIL